jgi:hypothetical protein
MIVSTLLEKYHLHILHTKHYKCNPHFGLIPDYSTVVVFAFPVDPQKITTVTMDREHRSSHSGCLRAKTQPTLQSAPQQQILTKGLRRHSQRKGNICASIRSKKNVVVECKMLSQGDKIIDPSTVTFRLVKKNHIIFISRS